MYDVPWQCHVALTGAVVVVDVVGAVLAEHRPRDEDAAAAREGDGRCGKAMEDVGRITMEGVRRR